MFMIILTRERERGSCFASVRAYKEQFFSDRFKAAASISAMVVSECARLPVCNDKTATRKKRKQSNGTERNGTERNGGRQMETTKTRSSCGGRLRDARAHSIRAHSGAAVLRFRRRPLS